MKRTALYPVHKKLGAKLVDFNGWELPVMYSSIREEHEAVRNHAGIFDVSHMGEFLVEGEDAESFLNYVLTNDISKLKDGKALYTVMCQEDGGILDDLIVYRLNLQKYLLCVNASNTDSDFAWLEKQKGTKYSIRLSNVSEKYAQIALQGPKSHPILQNYTKEVLENITFFYFLETELLGVPCIIARTGYTGEDGFEIYLPKEKSEELFCSLLEKGEAYKIKPCGLGARDTLRLEAALPLYGNDLTRETNPIEAGLSWVVKLSKPADFLGKKAIAQIKENGATKFLQGIQLLEKVIPRKDQAIYDKEKKEQIGKITSGSLSFTMQYPIALGYFHKKYRKGDIVAIKAREKFYMGKLVETPFYRSKKQEK